MFPDDKPRANPTSSGELHLGLGKSWGTDQQASTFLESGWSLHITCPGHRIRMTAPAPRLKIWVGSKEEDEDEEQ